MKLSKIYFYIIFSHHKSVIYSYKYFQWANEIRHHCEHPTIVLVGTKLDLRDDTETIAKLRGEKKSAITYTQVRLKRK